MTTIEASIQPVKTIYLAPPALSALAVVSKATDGDLLAIATGWQPVRWPETRDLALALFHERTGQHRNGVCLHDAPCDMARCEVLALWVLGHE